MQIDLKFDDRFLEALWSGEKTSTIRRSKREWDDTFFVEYGDLIMEFVITRVAYIPELSKQIAENVYLREGFHSSQDLMDYCKERGYTKDLYIHLFRLIHQRRKPKEKMDTVTTTVEWTPGPGKEDK